jgi:hypothetical protein
MRTEKQLAGQQRRSLRAIQRKLEDMAAEWGDVDLCNQSELHQLAEKAKEVAEGLIAE